MHALPRRCLKLGTWYAEFEMVQQTWYNSGKKTVVNKYGMVQHKWYNSAAGWTYMALAGAEPLANCKLPLTPPLHRLLVSKFILCSMCAHSVPGRFTYIHILFTHTHIYIYRIYCVCTLRSMLFYIYTHIIHTHTYIYMYIYCAHSVPCCFRTMP